MRVGPWGERAMALLHPHLFLAFLVLRTFERGVLVVVLLVRVVCGRLHFDRDRGRKGRGTVAQRDPNKISRRVDIFWCSARGEIRLVRQTDTSQHFRRSLGAFETQEMRFPRVIFRGKIVYMSERAVDRMSYLLLAVRRTYSDFS